MLKELFRSHGELCAAHPWEVIVATLTLTACMLSGEVGTGAAPTVETECWWRNGCDTCEDTNAVDMIIMTIIRCVAILYSYYQFCNLHRLGSKYILGIAGLFTVISSFVFSSTVINMMEGDTSGLKDALFFFLLLIDLSKATVLAQYALISSSPDEVKHNIAKGMAKLGPTITLDTIVETLVIGVGTLSGFHRLEVLCTYACMSVLVNFFVFMTFYPACLSLVLEMSRISAGGTVPWQNRLKVIAALTEDDPKPNPVVQRVKMIMSAGLMLVHARSRWPFRVDGDELVSPMDVAERLLPRNATEDPLLTVSLVRWVSVNADHIVVLILLLALTLKFILFEEDEQRFRKAERRDGQSSLRRQMGSVTFHLGDVPSLEAVLEDKEVQTEIKECLPTENGGDHTIPRDVDECRLLYKENGASCLTDEEVMSLVDDGVIPAYQLETAVSDAERGVRIRRQVVGDKGGFTPALTRLPYKNYDYSKVMGACCENVIGYMPVPVGVAGPLVIDGKKQYVPMATTEGCLVASTNRGARALLQNGICTRVVADGMTRGPVVRFPSMTRASEAMAWMQIPENFAELKASFDSSSRFARLTKIHSRIAGRHLFVRFVATTGDAMGMNMVSKGTELALLTVKCEFHDMEILSLSGNFCADKKPSAVNWIEGRGKSVVAEAIVPAHIVETVLKTSTRALVDVNVTKNLIGSAVAGAMGGFNAHAANIVTAIFIATGQDPAQNVESSNCITLMEPWGETGDDLYISCSMPSIEIGTVGGGTALPAQAACLDMLGVRGSNEECPGENACQLARVVCGTVLAGELSLMSALAAGHMVKAHLRHNRSAANVCGLKS